MIDYAITFAPTLDRPPETMVGETVFDGEGNAIGWIVNATERRSCVSCPEMDNPDSYISLLQSALKWHNGYMSMPTNPRNTCVVLEGEKVPEEVLFIGANGVTHYLPEATCHLEECEHEREVPYDLPDCDGGWYTEVTYDCDECGYENVDINISFCGGCGRKVVAE